MSKIKNKLFLLFIPLLLLSSCNNATSNPSNQESISSNQESTSSSQIISSINREEITNTAILIEDLITKDIPVKVVANIELLKSFEEYQGYSINWTSNNESIISSNGIYTIPENDIEITLHYKILYLGEEILAGNIKTTALGKNARASYIILDWLYAYNFDIPSPLTFPCSIRTSVPGFSDLKIEWVSTSTTYLKISENYLMPRSGTLAQTVTLRARIDVYGSILLREFKVNIPKKSDVLPQYQDSYHGLPIMDIKTNNGVKPTSTDYYIQGTFKMSKSQAYLNSDEVAEVPMQIKARGNWTAVPEKKPYRIKFDTKQSLLGMGACKNWILLADYLDESYLREATIKTFAGSLDGMAFNSRAYHVEVYLNGEYRGIYLLTDAIQIQETRVNIYENDTEVDTGYLFEWDWKTSADDVYNSTYFKVSGVDYIADGTNTSNTLHMEGPSQVSSAQRTFLSNYIADTFSKIKNNRTSVNAYSDIFNVNSAIDYIIVNELFKNQDVWHLSSYMFKDKGGPLEYGPVWDFHLSSGSCYYPERGIPNEWHTVVRNKNQWFYNFMQNDEFRMLFRDRWNEIVNNQVKDMMNYINERKNLINEAAYYSNLKWGVIRTQLPPLAQSLKTYDEFVQYFYDWTNASVSFINTEVNKASFVTSSYRSTFNFDYNGTIVSQKEKPFNQLPKYF